MDLVDYLRSTCLSVGAEAPLNFGSESWRRFFEVFGQVIAGTPSPMVHLAMPGCVLCKYCVDALRFDVAAR